MTEVLERLKAEVTRLQAALERAAIDLVNAKEQEAEAVPDSTKRALWEFERARLTLVCWSLECQLTGAVAALKAKEAELEQKEAHERLNGGYATTAWFHSSRERLEQRLAEGAQVAREMVASATDERAAQRRREEEARQEWEAELEQEQGQQPSM